MKKGDEYLPPPPDYSGNANAVNEAIWGNVEAENDEIIEGNVDPENELEWVSDGVDEQEGSRRENSLIDSDYHFEDENTDDDVAWQRNVDHDVVEVNVDDDVEDSRDEDIVVHDGDDFDERRVSDEETEHDVYPRFNKEVIFNPEFEVGMTFPSKELFKKAISSHAINTQRCLYFEKNDKIRIYAKCRGDDCEWFCHALKVKDEATFQIRNINRNHKCAPTSHVTNVSSKWLSEKYLSNFQDDPKRDISGWRRGVMRDLNVDVSRQQAYRARTKALAIIEGVLDLQYRELWNYADELRKSNPGSTIVLDTESIDGELRFSKMYMCFEAVKRGFRNECRPFIGVDGCWLKGPRGGILLSAVGVDPGNALYPLAYAVVPKENRETWEWFLILLKNDLEILNQENYTFMSDKQKGLILAFGQVFPNSEHRFCVRHMQNNFIRAGFRGEVYKDALWKAARASTVGVFNQRMREMREMNEAAANWFSDKHPSQWSKSHFNEKSKCDMLLNNGCESFNGTIKDARDKPILTMFEWIRRWLMERLQKNRDLANHKWKGRLPPKIKSILNKRIQRVGDSLPIKGNNRHYQIECGDGSLFSVDLELWNCSCRIWDLSGIPCKHALAAIMHQGGDPELFVHNYYSLETYRKVYEPALMPIAGQVDWAETIC